MSSGGSSLASQTAPPTATRRSGRCAPAHWLRPLAASSGPLAVWKPGATVLDAYAQLNDLLAKDSYGDADKAATVDLLKQLGLKSSDSSKWVTLRQNRGQLLRRSPGKDPVIVADGRTDWLGWLELRKEPLSDISIKNTGRVLKDLAADVQGVVEAESRIAFEGLSGTVLPNVGGTPSST